MFFALLVLAICLLVFKEVRLLLFGVVNLKVVVLSFYPFAVKVNVA
jgi:hypothetical protein